MSALVQMDTIRLRTVIPLIAANGALWSFTLFALAEAAVSLHARGNALRPEAVLLFLALPLSGLLLSVGLTSWLCYVEKRYAARWIAWLCLLCLWPAYFFLIVAPAAA
jgi:hypothetical protein